MTAAQTTPALKQAKLGLPDRMMMGLWKPLLVFVLFSLIITAGGYRVFQLYKETFTAEKQGDLGGIANLKIGQIVTWMAERRSDAQALTSDPWFTASVADWLRRGGQAGEARAKLEARLSSLQQAYAAYGYTSVLLFDDKANLRLSSREDTTPVPAMENGLLLKSMRTGQIVFSDIHRERHRDGESIEIDLIAPLFGGKNDPPHPIGAILIRIDAQRFLFPLIQHWPTPSASAENLLVRREGDEVVFLNELRHRKNTALDMRLPLTTELPAAMAAMGQEGMVTNGVDYRGVPVVSVLSKVPGTSWLMVSKIDKAEIHAPIDRLANWMSLLMLSLVVAGGGIAFCWRRKELKQHQNELDHQARFHRSERGLAEAQQLAHLGSWELDLANYVLTWSDENYRIFEIDPEKFSASYEAFLNIVHPDDRDWVNKAYTDSVRDKAPYDIVHRLQMQDGRIKYVNEICETYYDEDGKPLRSIGTTHDITGRKLAEIRFEREHNRLRTLVQTIPDPVWLKDVNGVYLGCNSQVEQLFGVKEAEIIGKSDFDFVDARIAEHFRQNDRKAMDAGKPCVNEEWGTFPNGQSMLVETIKAPLRDENGQVIGVIGIARDITERKQAERNLEKQKAFMRQVMDTDPSQIFVKDVEGNFLLVNQSAATAHDMTPNEMLGKNLADITHSPEEATGYLQTDREVIETGHQLNLVELHTLPDGEQRWMLTIKRRLTMPDGKLGTLGIAVDITEQKLAEMELAESYRELQRLALYLENVRADEREKIALNLHDEMGATLVAIKMGVAWLASKLPAETPRLSIEAARIGELVSGGIQTMRQIVTQLRPNLLADVGLGAAIRDYVEKYSRHTNIECILNLPDEDLALDAEQALTLFRILQESLNNVAKHAHADRVTIHFTAQEESLSMVIKDNGIGFDPAAQKDQSFGLLGIRERALMVGGKARISSTPGKGTRVSVSLPVSHQCTTATVISSQGVES